MSVGDIKSADEFRQIIKEDQITLVHFWVPWAKECPVMNEALEELAKVEQEAAIYRLHAEDVLDIPSEYKVTAVPTFIFYSKGQVLERIDGAYSIKVVNSLKRLLNSSPQDKISQRCKALINSEPAILFMKGHRDEPKCKFSRAAIAILNSYNADYGVFDILLDDQIREGLKEYSNWPTYPQLYVKGEFIGGVDIMKEMHETKELEEILPKKKDLNVRLKELINQSPIVIFMKGNPSTPKCGFSKQLMEMLKPLNVTFTTFDILEDEEVRQGLKTYSNWPTYPQLYVNGELIGGLDILKEMNETKELEAILPKKNNLNARLKELINQSPIVIFMKGNPNTPKCGFSRQLMEMLKPLNLKFTTFDILEDEEVRQGLKTYSNWPTYPQIYVKGELIGGLDIIKELQETSELLSTLSIE
uniref:Monothiol glutaredoxinS17like [Cucumis sativus] n=1 Tax=Lepeophtheirus salmonis TaxID=72036 RepID=A0A0K2U3Z3_LEPSM